MSVSCAIERVRVLRVIYEMIVAPFEHEKKIFILWTYKKIGKNTRAERNEKIIMFSLLAQLEKKTEIKLIAFFGLVEYEEESTKTDERSVIR